MKIAILGAGAYGTALGNILVNNDYDVAYYDPKFEKDNLNEVLDGAEYVLYAAPSEAASELLPKLPHDLPLIVASKGFLNDRVFEPFIDWIVISGPGYAADIEARKTTRMTITDSRLEQLFATDFIQFDKTDDKRGVLMCGALKNVYALIAGTKNLERGSDEWNDYIKQVSEEIKSILIANGAKSETFELACGLEDLKLTCGLPSRNFEFGQKLALGNKSSSSKTIEGLNAINCIKRGEIVVPTEVKYLNEIKEISCN